MALTWPATQGLINIPCILEIWATNCLIPPMYAYIMSIHICTREVYGYQYLRTFPKQNLISTHCIISLWWLQIIYGLVHYVIFQ